MDKDKDKSRKVDTKKAKEFMQGFSNPDPIVRLIENLFVARPKKKSDKK